MRICWLAMLLIAGLPLAAQDFYRLDKEAALGRQLASGVSRRTPAIDNSSVQDFVRHLGTRISAQIAEAKFPFTLSAIADDLCPTTHEPIALPGGYIFVPAALFMEARDEAEFAGMLAHSMEHVAHRHATRPATGGRTPLIFLGGWNGCSDGQAIPLGFVAIQRRNELEADGLAVEAMAHAGFDPEALVRYIERVQPPLPKAFSSVASVDQRTSTMRAVIERLPPKGYEVSSEEFTAIQRQVSGLLQRR